MKSKLLTIAAVATMAASTPVLAKVDPDTGDLIRTIERTGYTVSFDKCPPGTEGYFAPFQKAIVICDHADPASPSTHSTVRHEAWHLLQHCTAQTTVDPIFRNKTEFVSFVKGNLDQHITDFVFSVYPQERHAVELEAYTAERVLTASQISEAIKTYCF